MRFLTLISLSLLLAAGCGDDRRRGGPRPFVDSGARDGGPITGDGAVADTGPAEHCGDGVRNGDESHTDCGGSCRQCPDGAHCNAPADCESAVCRMGFCLVPSCMDGTLNGMEVGVDCGGGGCDACPGGTACTADEQCLSGMCASGTCTESSCEDSLLNGDETDIDCGGSCPACEGGAACTVDEDCLSTICASLVCTTPSCSDSVRNQDETDVDCGGSVCAPCVDGRGCGTPADCGSGVCSGGRCISCVDMVQNGNETDVDCGGADCMACADGSSCSVASDCTSVVCTAGSCIGPTCSDGVINQDESDVDCGGMVCAGCPDGDVCTTFADCASGVCTGGLCAAPTCTDGVENGGETDIDCGGATACPRCPDFRTCTAGTDCVTGTCTSGFCGTIGCASFGMAAGYIGCQRSMTVSALPCDDIRTTGTSLGITSHTSHTVTLPFSFTFNGVAQTSLRIHTSGGLSFDTTTATTTSACLPTTTGPRIATLWDHLHPRGGTYYQVLGTAPNRRFVVLWDAEVWPDTNIIDVRAVLYEGSNDIDVCFVDTTTTSATYNHGSTATSGIQDTGMTIQFSCRTPTLTEGLLLSYIAP